MTRAPTAGQQIRLSEYQEEKRRQMSIADPQNHREYELMADAHDVRTAQHYRGFEDLSSSPGKMFSEIETTLAVIVIDMNVAPPGHRALISPIRPTTLHL